jgi:FADH2 O2-dependent halogenase
LGKGNLPQTFLLHDHPVFGPQCLRLFQEALAVTTPRDTAALCESIFKTIEPFNVAGLGDDRRRNWYRVDAEDLFNNAAKLGASKEEISQMLHRAGFRP